MFDFLRHITRPADEKQRERLNAYVDGALPPRQRADFEQELARDEALRAEVAQLRAVRAQLRALPRLRVPRQFTLDPAVYGRPQREPLVRAYPALRLATAMTAFFFILTVALQLFTSSAGMPLAAGAVSQVESTRIVSEMAAEAETAELAAPFDAQPAAEVPAEVDVQMEEAAEEEAAEVFEEMETAAAEDEAAAAEADAAAPEPRVVETPAPLGTATAAAPQAGVAAAPPAEATSALPTATPTETPTNTPQPTATRSELPRATAESAVADRGVAPGAAATAVPTPAVRGGLTFDALVPWLAIALGILLVGLGVLTVLAHRRLL